MVDSVVEALARLDADLADAEQQLALAQQRVDELRSMRANVLPFVERYVSAPVTTTQTAPEAPRYGSLTDAVLRVFQQRPNAELSMNAVLDALKAEGFTAERIAVKNAIHGSVRKGALVNPIRGRFALKDTSTPVAAGVEVNGESYKDSPGEIGGSRDEASAPPHDQDGGAGSAPDHFDRVGDRAPIGG